MTHQGAARDAASIQFRPSITRNEDGHTCYALWWSNSDGLTYGIVFILQNYRIISCIYGAPGNEN